MFYYYIKRNESKLTQDSIDAWEDSKSILNIEDLIPSNLEEKRKFKEKSFPRPRRALSAGRSYGLSILLRPNIHEYFCTTSDSVGFRVSKETYVCMYVCQYV